MGLMSERDKEGKTKGLIITSAGFAFLFKSQQSQVWDVVLSYMEEKKKEEKPIPRDEVLRVLFKLSFMKLGQDYSSEGYTQAQIDFLNELSRFGLIYRSHNTSPIFYPTPLAVNLSQHSSALSSSKQQKQGFIFVETSFKLYAFTNSPFQLALLNLFSRLDYQLPNMVVGVITKRSVRNAFKHNISADELIRYLSDYAHPRLKQEHAAGLGVVGAGTGSGAGSLEKDKEERSVVEEEVPRNISDQIRLWEGERNRMSMTASVMLEDFSSSQEFEQTEKFTREKNVLLWCDSSQKLLVTTALGYELVKEMRANRQKSVDPFLQ